MAHLLTKHGLPKTIQKKYMVKVNNSEILVGLFHKLSQSLQPYFRLMMRQTTGGIGVSEGVTVTIQNMFLRVSVKPYVRSIKLF